jgi:sugar lactone lactonase YvrE
MRRKLRFFARRKASAPSVLRSGWLLAVMVAFASLAAAPTAVAFPGEINTFAGTGAAGFSGDGGPAISAKLNNPQGMAVDGVGDLYIADSFNYRVRKVATAGTITTVAGNGALGFSGDGGPATSAKLYNPSDVAFDGAGNLYIADAFNNRVRKVDLSGTITTVAGTGSKGFSGDGGPATSAQLNYPVALAFDGAGNLYIDDTRNNRIRKVDPSGTMTTFAGSGGTGPRNGGFSGDGGPATTAQLNSPLGVAVDGAGNLYIADTNNHRVRKVDPSGTITTFAGSGGTLPRDAAFSGDGGSATSARLSYPDDVAVGGGGIYIATYERVRKVNGTGTITTVAGGGSDYPGDGGPATSAGLRYAGQLTVDSAGNFYISDDFGQVRWVEGGDTVPPNTRIAGPRRITNDPTPTFAFSSQPHQPATTFGCKLDSGPYEACSPPKLTLPHLADGSHTFRVRATDPSGNTDPTPATRKFIVRTAFVRVSGTALVVTTAPGARDNLQITRPSDPILRVTDFPSGAYTGSGIHTGAGCTRSGDYTANCLATAITPTLPALVTSAGQQADKVVNSSGLPSSLYGGAGEDLLIGGPTRDLLNGGAGVDVLQGLDGNDLLQAHDWTSDKRIDCGAGSDKADLDLLPKDPNVEGCETKTRH